jgi:hypothetical protein
LPLGNGGFSFKNNRHLPKSLPLFLNTVRGTLLMKPRHVVALTFISTTAVILPVRSVFAEPKIGNCSIFPANNIWNTPIDTLPADPDPVHQGWIDAIGRNTKFHMDFGAAKYQGRLVGVPYNVVDRSKLTQPFQCSPITFPKANLESERRGAGCYQEAPTDLVKGYYALPDKPLIEGGSDKHLLSVDQDNCVLYELFLATYNNTKRTGTGNYGVVWPLNSNVLRPKEWTSADGAGLPILPGLIRYEEAATGVINHAIRFTVPRTDGTFIWPARHKTTTSYVPGPGVPVPPPMGAHLRLKKTYSNGYLETFPEMKAIINAMKTYGIINADNGSPWYITGQPNVGWNDARLALLANSLMGNDFEAVDTRCMMVNEDSGQADILRCTPPPPPVVTCTYTVTAGTNYFPQSGGNELINVTTSDPSCTWTAAVDSSTAWVTLAGSTTKSFAGSQMVNYTVSPNNDVTAAFRTGTLSVAGQSIIVTQQSSPTSTCQPTQ